MGIKYVSESECPKCDLCKVNPAAFDAPMGVGMPWAYQCMDCASPEVARYADKGGTVYKIREPVAPKADSTAVQGIEPAYTDVDYWAGAFDGDRHIECPSCGEERSVEPDADYKYTCEGCGTRVQVPAPIC